MPPISFTNLLVTAAVAVLAPLLLGFAPRLHVPAAVVEILAGVVLGPSVLGWLRVDLPVSVLAVLGLAFLLFLAGLEIDLQRVRGAALRSASLGYALTLGLGLGVGLAFAGAGWTGSALLLAVALSATSLGLVVPVLKDAGQAERVLGQVTIAGATVADFCAIVLLSLFFSMAGGGPGSRLGLLALFVGLVLAVAAALSRAGRSMGLGTVLVRLQDTTAEIRVRLAVLLLVGFVVLAEHAGLETILGAFLAGALISLLDRDASSHPHLGLKLEAIGYGVLVPVFFVASGARLDLRGLLEQPSALLRVPAFLAALLLVRGLPALLYRRSVGGRGVVAAGLLQATSLPFLVTVAAIGTELGAISSVTGATLVCAGLASVLIFPALALTILRGDASGPDDRRPATPAMASG